MNMQDVFGARVVAAMQGAGLELWFPECVDETYICDDYGCAQGFICVLFNCGSGTYGRFGCGPQDLFQCSLAFYCTHTNECFATFKCNDTYCDSGH